jgi:hypothetical protein
MSVACLQSSEPCAAFALVDYSAEAAPGRELRVAAAAADRLRAIKGPVQLVVIVGSTRSGKSTLLNLLTRSTAFEASAGVDACTMGLRAALVPAGSDQAAAGAAATLLYVDSQGLFDGNVNDAKMITLCALLADVLIYNVPGVITSSSVANLAAGVQLAQSLSAGGGDAAGAQGA